MQSLWRGMRVVVCWAGLVVAMSAAEFSRSLTPAEFAAAGLDKLSAAELARLDALVQARRERDAAEHDAAASRDSAITNASTATKPSSPGLFARMRVVLKPGTEIAYETVETEITSGFRGYEPGKVLTLANGQRWRVVDGNFWAPARDANRPRKVTIEPGVLGSFFLRIEDGGRPKVKYVGMAN
ncbi:hypothetical protein [Opitutus terrae]|uniref:Uncharacterized protein n=1 Tax=Opitutus terrae (strain DSM 11246 / JCM 15787 / PB90-1) TaxID=452637 RepID=B1ZTS6_OPITP|nr:hypothetical protein [Opitutus terrae]ACB74862.1 conserved hypothetical protein [Opitutus terrae PB90-1]